MRVRLGVAAGLIAAAAWAQEPQGPATPALARLDVTQSRVTRVEGGVAVTLFLSQPVPWRVFALDAPRRLVVDFRELDWRGARAADMIEGQSARDVRFEAPRPGWSRMVVDLAGPFAVAEAAMTVGEIDGTATLTIRLEPVDAATFAAAAGAPPDEVRPEAEAVAEAGVATTPGTASPDQQEPLLVVAIDPGPGMTEGGQEASSQEALRLAFGREIAAAVARSGTMRAVLTRQAGEVLALADRLAVARVAGADVIVLLDPQVAAEFALAEGTDREALPGAEAVPGQGTAVEMVLADLARRETGPAAERLAKALAARLGRTEGGLSAGDAGAVAEPASVDLPAVLVGPGPGSGEPVGLLPETPERQAAMASGIAAALEDWVAGEQALWGLMPQ